MAEGTVRGAFDLDTRPAIRGVREYRREAARADAQTKQLGATMDRTFSRQEGELKTVRSAWSDLGSEVERVEGRMRLSMEAKTRAVREQTIAVRELRTEVSRLGRERATPRVNVEGVSEALAQVELLESRLNRLGRTRSTPRVAMGGGFAQNRVGGIAGGGGSFGSAAGRARSGAARAGGGMVVGGASSATSAAASGGGGSGILSMGGIGFAGVGGGALAAGAAVALPAVQALGGAVTALAGSLAGAGLGAGAVGLAGGGVLGVGLASILAIAKPATKELQTALKAQQKYNAAVQDFGRSSKQAATAKREMDQAFARDPGMRRASTQITGFRRDWRAATAPGRQDFFGMVGDVAQVGRRAAPMLGRDANTVMSATRGQGTRFARFLAGPQTQATLGVFANTFARELPTAERTLENVTVTFEHLSRAALPFFHDANVWVEHWTGGWRTSTANIAGTRDKLRPLVQDFKDWRDLSISVFDTVRDLFSMGAPAGDSMVVDLTRTFDRWDAWIKANPAKVRAFFGDTVSSTEKIATALGKVVGFLNDMATALRPLLDRFSQLVGLASSLGLIGTPGAAAGLLGAYRGLKGGLGGGRGAGGLALTGGAALMGGGGGARETATAAARIGYLAPATSMLATTTGRQAAGVGMDERSMLLGMMGGRPMASFGGALIRRGAGAATPEAFAARYGTVEGARFAGPMSQLGSRAYGLSRAGAAVRPAVGAARGFAKAALPTMALFAAMDAASTQGTAGERIQQAVSGLSFGIIPGATTGAMARQQGQDAAAQDIAGLGPATNVRDIRSQIATLRARRGRYAGRTHADDVGGLFGGTSPIAAAFRVGGHDQQVTQADARRNASRVAEYTKGIRDLTRAEEQLHRQRRRELDDLSKQRAQQYGAGLHGAYETYRRSGQSRAQAAESTREQLAGRLSKIRDAGVETLGESGLAWAKALEKHAPEAKGVVAKLTQDIEDRFKRMGKSVHIVNGNILTGSKSEWNGIRDQMAGASEQAREKVMADFTAIQNQAVGSLRSMGFSERDAKQLVSGAETSAQGASGLQTAASLAGSKNAGERQAARNVPGALRLGNRRARGGVIGGAGLMDTVPTPDGGMAAPGEAWIANRHTMADLSRATVAMYGRTAQQMITGESRRHSMKFARGGPSPQNIARSGGALAGVNASVGNAATMVMSKYPDLSVTSTTGGRHARNSLHYRHAAVDLGGPQQVMDTAALWIAKSMGPMLTEGIHNPGLSIRNGSPVSSSTWGGTVWGQHRNHIHLGVLGGGGARAAGAAAGAMAMGGPVSVSGVGQQQGGVPGVLRQRAGDIFAAGLSKKLTAAVGSAGGGDLSNFTGGGDAAANRRLGKRMMLAAGYGADQWPSLDKLWNRESGWSSTARNPSSGALGIPQALGHGNVFASGDAPGQIRWGLGYIGGRYGSPDAAWAHEQSAGWYARGGRMSWAGGFRNGGSFVTNGPTAFVAGEGHRRRERVTVTPPTQRPSSMAGGPSITIESGAVTVKIDGGLHHEGDIAAAAEKVGEAVVKKVLEALRKGTNGVVD